MIYLVISGSPTFEVNLNLVLNFIDIAYLTHTPVIDCVFGINIAVKFEICNEVVILSFFEFVLDHNDLCYFLDIINNYNYFSYLY